MKLDLVILLRNLSLFEFIGLNRRKYHISFSLIQKSKNKKQNLIHSEAKCKQNKLEKVFELYALVGILGISKFFCNFLEFHKNSLDI